MNSKLEGEVTLLYVGSGLSKKGKPWLRLSNGLETKFVGTDVHPDDFSEYNEGDEIVCIMQVDGFNPFNTKVLSLVE